MSLLVVRSIEKEHEGKKILKGISFAQGAFQKFAIAGETGSGKTTLLKIIAGLDQPSQGEIIFAGDNVKGSNEKLVPGHPAIAYLPQFFELPKFLRVEQVLAYSNKLTDREATRLFKLCHIQHLLKRKTNELSGGERQRIALCRLLIGKPTLLLLDEPFSNLDLILKSRLKEVIHDVSAVLKITCLLVSHDPDDTLPWADEILVMRAGKIIQQGAPKKIYRQPINAYVAGLFGKFIVLPIAKTKLPKNTNRKFLRPEDFKLVNRGPGTLKGIVRKISFLGNGYEVEASVGKQTIAINTDRDSLKVGQDVLLALKKADPDIGF